MSEAFVIADLKRRIAELRLELTTAIQLARVVMAESSTDASAEILRVVFASAFDAMLLTNDDGHVIDANAAACTLFARPLAELTRCTIADLAPPGYQPPAAWERFVAEGQLRGELALARADGTARAVQFSAVANILPGLHLTVLRDPSADL